MTSGRRLRVTFVLPFTSAHPIGGFLVIYEYANRLVARGHRVVVLHGWPPRSVAEPLGIWPPREFEKNVSWFTLDPRVNVRFENVLEPQLLPEADFVMNALSRSGYLPRHGVRGLLVQGFGLLPESEELAELRAPCLKICVSRWVCKRLLDLGCAPSDVVYVPNGVDTSLFRPSAPVATRPRRVAMLLGTVPVKGNEVGLAVLELLRGRMPDVEAVVFGVLPRPSELPRWIEHRHLPSREELAREVYGRSALLICPSRAEGFYLCGLEAMACGCVFVSTDLGGVRDYAEHGVTALLSTIDDVNALADNAGLLLTDASLRQRMAQAGIERARNFSWERSTDALEEHLNAYLHSVAS